MDFASFKAIFIESFTRNNLNAYTDERIVEQFYKLTHLMLEKNSVMNITAIKDIEKIISLHYADCLKVVEYIPAGAKVIDIGCGGGFPTLPLAIVRDDISILGVDSTEKKIKYVSETARELCLNHVNAISARAEELIKMPQMREAFDVVVSRAVARLNILDELCLPFVKIGGRAIIMKGSAGNEEMNEAKCGIEMLGGKEKLIAEDELIVNNQEIEKRTQIIIEKIRSTPERYPRQFGQIKKKPL